MLSEATAACCAEAYNPPGYALVNIHQDNHGLSVQLNLQGSASAGRDYTVGSHPGVFQTGFEESAALVSVRITGRTIEGSGTYAASALPRIT